LGKREWGKTRGVVKVKIEGIKKNQQTSQQDITQKQGVGKW